MEATITAETSSSLIALTMRHEIMENMLLVVHGPGAPAAADWSAFCHCHGTQPYLGSLIVVDRGCPGPNSHQRAELNAAYKARGSYPRVAVVTASATQRGIVRVMTWLQGTSIAAFAPARLVEALEYAGVPQAASRRIMRRVHELAASVNAPWIVQTVTLGAAAAGDG